MHTLLRKANRNNHKAATTAITATAIAIAAAIAAATSTTALIATKGAAIATIGTAFSSQYQIEMLQKMFLVQSSKKLQKYPVEQPSVGYM